MLSSVHNFGEKTGYTATHIDKQEMEIRRNWKWKLETESGTNNAPFTDTMFHLGKGRAWERCYLFCAL